MRWRVVILAGSLAALPGCFTIAAAAAGGSPGVVRAAGELDGAFLGALVGGATSGGGAAPEEPDAWGSAPLADGFVCELEAGEVQEIAAHSLEGARAVCLMSNDVDQRGGGCTCAPIGR